MGSKVKNQLSPPDLNFQRQTFAVGEQKMNYKSSPTDLLLVHDKSWLVFCRQN